MMSKNLIQPNMIPICTEINTAAVSNHGNRNELINPTVNILTTVMDIVVPIN